MTKSTSAWGWLAAGVLALGVNGFLHDEGADLARQVADRVVARSEAVLAVATGQAEQFLATAQMLGAREQVRSCRLNSVLVRVQSRMAAHTARVEAMSVRQEAQLARLEAQKALMEAQMAQFQFNTADFNVPDVHVACPRVRVNIPSPVVRVPSPIIHVKPMGTGSI